MVFDLSPFRTIVGINAQGVKRYQVDYSYLFLGEVSESEGHTLLDPADPDAGTTNPPRQERINGWHQNCLDELLAQNTYIVVEILESSKAVLYDEYLYFDANGVLQTGTAEHWTLVLRFSYTFETRERSSAIFDSEVEGADWMNHVPPGHQYDLRLEAGPYRV
ncbi:MAG: hypothetical protein ACU0B9_07360 [Limimaricola soesokkakensis]|uniref:hypothetical protein n=1 Tax=Limimaricola soesokkakensis TaxID=1343159 RepID=UPI00405A1A3D